jgi:hypothetical protein
MEARAEYERRTCLYRQAQYKERMRQENERMARYKARFKKKFL